MPLQALGFVCIKSIKESPMFKKLLVLMSFLALLPMQAMAEELAPQDVIKTAVGGVIDVLKVRKDQTSLSSEDRDAIRKAVDGCFDFPEMAKRALAAPWKELNDTQKKEFVATFQELLELTYGNRLADYHDQKIEYGEVFIKGRIAVVDSEVVDADKRTPVRYKLVHKDAGWGVYDIQIEGISMVNTFRTDFSEAVNKDGIKGFLSGLKGRVTSLKEQDQSKG